MASLSVIISIFITLTLYINSVINTTSLPQKNAALFIFGDSLFDPGNNDYINTTTSFQANFRPYGETFFNYPTGRFSDGRLISDFIAEYAKLPLIPAFMDPKHHDEYSYGVNFASGGAGALVETHQGDVIDLKTQISQFKQVSKRLKQKLGDTKAKKLLSSAVYLFSAGGNDYITLRDSNGTVVLPYPPQEFLNFVIGNLSYAIKEVYNEGGRNFGFSTVPPLDCLPSVRRLVYGNETTTIHSCLEGEITTIVRSHNKVLPKMLQKLEKQLKGFRYSVFDFYHTLVKLMKHPSKYGFKNGTVACCGSGLFGGIYSCGGKRGIEEYELCKNVNEYVFFDSFHPTEKAYQHFANLLWSGDRNVIIGPYNLKQLFGIA